MKKIDIHADGIAPYETIIDDLIEGMGITGFTCNPSLVKAFLPMRYRDYCSAVIDHSRGLPVSIQVLSSIVADMRSDAYEIASWGANVYVKIPIINEYGQSCANLIVDLLDEGIKVNVTAMFHAGHVTALREAGLVNGHDCILSVFAGRISDTGILPNSVMRDIDDYIGSKGTRDNIKLLWAGVRTVTDINYAADYCDIITIPQPVLDKMSKIGYSLDDYCLDTVKMFANDSKNFTL